MENDYLWFGLAGVCVLLMLTGIILLLTCTRRRHSGAGKVSYGQPVPTTVHSIDDLPLDFERAVERVAQKRMPAQDFNIQRLSPDPEDRVLPARPVSPLTSWDPIKPAHTFKTLQDFSQGEMRDTAPATQEKPVMQERPVVYESPIAQARPVPQEKPAAPKAPTPAFDNDERLLLLKSHELLLTLSEGLKKLSTAKTDASRKEKIAEMMKAVSLLDAKNAWDEYKACFDKINPEFWARIEKSSEEPMLPYELRLCALLAMGMSAKEAAELTNRSVRTVETSIYKIRKKLNIDAEEKTQDYLKRLL
ncbi:MAG: hypothetical protein K2H68_06125 [Bacteroidales bacterium]|nr:hypothetical protein [Bacteroidales bacterium]